jgi:uncharacterized protein YkwD
MTRRTSVVLLVLLLTSVWWLGVLAVGESAIGAKARRSWRTARTQRGARGATVRARTAASSSCRNAYARPARANIKAIDAAIACLVNRERSRHGLGAVRSNHDLDAIAASQATDMVARGYFGDNSPSGKTAMERVAASPYGWHSHNLLLGQNIGWGIGTYATPQAIVAGWMQSAPHRQIILTANYRDIGTGATAAAPVHRRAAGATYVLELATRAH